MKYAAKITHKLCYALVILCLSTSVRGERLAKTAELIPPNTILLVDIHDFSQLTSQLETTNFSKLCKDPAMKRFVDDFKSKWQEKIRKHNNELVRTITDIDVLPEGRAALALIFDEQTKDFNEPPLLLISQWGRNIDKIKETVAKIVQKAIENEAHRKAEDYRGVDIITIIRSSGSSLSYCFVDDCLIVAISPDVLKFVIAHIKGADSPTLADEADYTGTMRVVESSRQGQINLYVNIKQLVKTTIAEDRTGKVKVVMGNLGIDNVSSFGCSIGFGNPSSGGGGVSLVKAFLKIEGGKKGVCRMLDIESATFRAPPFIPSSAYSVSFFNLNIKKAYNELGNILTRFSPQLAAIMYMPLLPQSPQGEPPLQLKTDVIDHLGSQIISARSLDETSSDAEAPRRSKSIIAVAIDNSGALEKSLSTLHSKVLSANNSESSRQLLGHTIYLVDIAGIIPSQPKSPMQLVGSQTGQKPQIAFTITETHLILGTESAVEEVIRTLNSTETVSLDSVKWFNRCKSIIPSVVGLVGLENNATSGKVFWSELRRTDKKTNKDKNTDPNIQIGVGVKPGSPFPQLMLSGGGSELFDFSLLPEFDEVRKYFGLSAFYGISRPDGFFFEFKHLNAQADN